MSKLEKDVMKSIAQLLTVLRSTGDIIWFSRLNTGKIRTEWGSWVQLCEEGTPDFIIIVKNKNKDIEIVFAECKSDTGKLLSEQVIFKDKYSKHKGVHVLTITDVLELNKYINNISYDRLDDIKMEF